MKIIAFVEAREGRQDEVIRKILEHCDLWRDPPPRAPPKPAAPSRPVPWQAKLRLVHAVEIDPDFL